MSQDQYYATSGYPGAQQSQQGMPPQQQGYPQQGMPGTPGIQAQQQGYPGGYQAQPQQQQPQQQRQNTFKEVIRTNYTTIALFEVSAGFDPQEQFPKCIAFVMGMPGQKDASKQSGRTYIPANKITMKFSMQELKSLGQMLINLATFKAAAMKFEKHSDPSKNSYSQNQGTDAKKITASYDQAKDNIVVTMNWGAKNVFVPVPLQDAFGLGHNLINLGNVADHELARFKVEHHLKNEEIHGIDYDPAGTEEVPQQGYTQGYPAQPQGMPAGYPQQGMPQQGMPQQGMPQQGMPQQGMPQQGMPQHGMPQHGMPGYPAGYHQA